MQADRSCYVRRAADDQLVDTIAAGHFAYVLAPRAMGKSSLMGRTIRRLRVDGQMAAVVDLNQIAARGETVDSVRWHYSIAYRICRELRLKFDLQTWWHNKNLLISEQRLVEFFWDVVLAHTASQITVFFDEVERAVEQPSTYELFAAVHSCYMRRVSEPEFSRLNFVVLGAATREQLCPDPNASPFVTGRKIRLEDFTLEECAALAPGLGQPEAVASQLLAQIHAWTRGQPYLTQKLARGIARRHTGPADVESVVHELFLAPNISREEPLLSQMRSLVTDASARSRQAAAIVARLAKGREVIDAGAPAQQLLYLGGLVSSDDNGMLRFRNRIVERVFGSGLAGKLDVRQLLKPIAAGAAILAAVLLLPYWYVRVLPAGDIAALTASRDSIAVEQAHASLRRFPGFGGRADRMFSDALLRLGVGADSIEQIRSFEAMLRTLPDGSARADSLLADFWLRRARASAGRGERDGALVHALAASATGSTEAKQLAVNLIDGDYLKLEQSVYLDSPPLAVAADWERHRLVVVDAERRVRRYPLGAEDGSAAERQVRESSLSGLRLTALQHVGVTRGFFVDEPGLAGDFELRLTVEHGRTSDLLVRLRAPSGAAAELALPQRSGDAPQFIFKANVQNGLARLSDESITGQWELTLVDRLVEETGRLLSWGLRFPGVAQPWDDEPTDGLPVPDPAATEQVAVVLTNDGRFAVSLPVRADARGAASVWDLSNGEKLSDLPLAERAEAVAWLTSGRLLIVGQTRATLWDPRSGASVQEYFSAAGFAARPAVSPEGGFFALTDFSKTATRIRLFGASDGALVNEITGESPRDWILGPRAEYIAGIDGSRRGRVINPMTGELMTEFFHERALMQLFPASAPDRVVAVDEAGDMFSWTLTAGRTTLSPGDSRYLGSTQSDSSIDLALNAVVMAFQDSEGFIAVSRATDGRRFATLEHGESKTAMTQLSPSADQLISVSDSLIRSWTVGSIVEESIDFGPISAIAIDPSGRFSLLGYRSGEIRKLSGLPAAITNGTATEPVTGHRGVVTRIAINASGTRAASGDSDGVIRTWDVSTGSRDLPVMRHPSGPIGELAFGPDDRWLLSAGANSARVFEIATGRLVTEIELEGTPFAVAFSADGSLIAVGDSAGNIVLASPDDTVPARTIRGLTPITALAFSAEPSLLASGSANGELVVWDTLSVSKIGNAQVFADPIRWLEVTADASVTYLLSGGWLHAVERSDEGLRIRVSRLLPELLRSRPSLAMTGETARALASVGGGRLALADVSLSGSEGSAAVETMFAQGVATVPDRDWDRAIGLRLEPLTGEILPFGP